MFQVAGAWGVTEESGTLLLEPRVLLNAPLSTLPKILCLWASESDNLLRRHIKHLAAKISGGDWASYRIDLRSLQRPVTEN